MTTPPKHIKLDWALGCVWGLANQCLRATLRAAQHLNAPHHCQPAATQTDTQAVSMQEFEWLLEGFDLWKNKPHKTLVIDRNYGATNDRIYGAIFSSVFTPCGYLIFA